MDDPSRKYVAYVDPQHAMAMDLVVSCARNILLVKPHLEKMERAERHMGSIGWATHPTLYKDMLHSSSFARQMKLIAAALAFCRAVESLNEKEGQ